MQTRVVLERIAATLAECGATMAHVVKATIWLADLDDFAAFNAEYAKHFAGALPARSSVQAVLYKGAKVEIEVQALGARRIAWPRAVGHAARVGRQARAQAFRQRAALVGGIDASRGARRGPVWAIRQKVSKSSNLRRRPISRVSICTKPAPCQRARRESRRAASTLGGQSGAAPSAAISSCSALNGKPPPRMSHE